MDKTIAISTFGWTEWECDAFEQYVKDLASDFYTNISIVHTVDHYFEVDIDAEDTAVEYLILRAANQE